MNIECDKCHAHNHLGNLVIECVNCRSDLSDIYTKKIHSKKYFVGNVLKMVAGSIVLAFVFLLVYEFQLRKTWFAPRHTHLQEYHAIKECVDTIQVNGEQQDKILSACLEALQRLQTEQPDLPEINPKILKNYAEISLLQNQ